MRGRGTDVVEWLRVVEAEAVAKTEVETDAEADAEADAASSSVSSLSLSLSLAEEDESGVQEVSRELPRWLRLAWLLTR